MSNERIDLTQFKEITKGAWEVIDTPNGRIDIGVRQGGGYSPVVTFTEGMANQVRNIPRDVADMNAIAAVPKLIAELKRCYDLIDAQKENLEFLNGAIEKLHEETWTEAVGEFVEEHHPSEWCDYAGCWKCEEEPASE